MPSDVMLSLWMNQYGWSRQRQNDTATVRLRRHQTIATTLTDIDTILPDLVYCP